MEIIPLSQLPIKGKKVIMRVDFNVPIDKTGNIIDDTRIMEALPTIRYIIEQGASLILMSHLGRPKGKKSLEFSLKPVAQRLEKILGKNIIFTSDCIGEEIKNLVSQLKSGEILLLENLRFYPFEEKPEENPEFAQSLSELADFYVNDAFGAAHRSHASTVDIVRYFPKKASAGFLLEKEINFLGNLLQKPKRPLIALIGGSKISTKLQIIKKLLPLVDTLLIGGGMAYTFYKAQGLEIGNSIFEENLIEEAKNILDYVFENKLDFCLPIDHVVVDNIANVSELEVIRTKNGIPSGKEGVDIGPETIHLFKQRLEQGKTVFWNGPVGIYEIEAFSKGTKAIAAVIASLDATTIVGGGDSVAALQTGGFASKVTHVSTGGGAALEYLELGTLPAIEALKESSKD